MRLDRYDQGGYAGGGITENGGNISGPLVLAGNPSQTLEAVPKQYVDAYFNSLNASNLTAGTLSAARLPGFTGDLLSSEGSSELTLKNSGITAGTYPKVSVNSKGIVTAGSNITDSDIPFGLNWSKINAGSLPTSLSGYGITDGVSVNGATMIGFLSLTQPATANTHAVTKQYIDALVSNGGIAVGDILRKPYSTTPAGFLKCNGAEVDKTTYSDLYAVIGDQYVQGSVIGSGRPWEQQYQINTTQATDITGWAAETSLPTTIGGGHVLVTKNRVYLLGGSPGSAWGNYNFTATINADGTLGAWSSGTAIPTTLGNSSLIVTKNRVYLIGGTSSTNGTYSSTWTAAINADGTLGTWYNGPNLPTTLSFTEAIVIKNRVYAFGGHNGTSVLSTVYTATISSDGVIDTFTLSPFSLPYAALSLKAIVTKNRVYLITTGTNDIFVSSINSDGTLGSWSIDSNRMPISIVYSRVFVTKDKAYVLGGYSGGAGVSIVYNVTINSDGTLGTWSIGSSLPGSLYLSSSAVVKNRLYLIGGHNGTSWVGVVYSAPINGGLNDYSEYYSDKNVNYMMPGSGRPWEQQYQINNTQTNNITGWASSGNLPIALAFSTIVVTKNRVYMIGGHTSSTVIISTVYTAPINSDGTLGPWTTGNAFPIAIYCASAIVVKNKVYIIGGNNSSNLNTVYTAPINADGTLGSWTTSTSLPSNVGYNFSFITKNRVYVISGITSVTYTAPINSDGTLGAWTTGTSTPVTVDSAQLAVTKNRVYMIGGYTTTPISNIYCATINSDGVLSPWFSAGNLPGALSHSKIIIMKNSIYLLGGYTGTSNVSTVYTAPINADGTLGTWTTGTSLPGVLNQSSAIITKNRVYLLGGDTNNNAAYTSVIYSASILEGLNDYSEYYDGTIIPIEPIDNSSKFKLPDLTTDDPFGSYSYIKY